MSTCVVQAKRIYFVVDIIMYLKTQDIIYKI